MTGRGRLGRHRDDLTRLPDSAQTRLQEGRHRGIREIRHARPEAAEGAPEHHRPRGAVRLGRPGGPRDEPGSFTIPQRPIRRRLQDVPPFVVTRGGEYCFAPSVSALRWLAELDT